MTDYHKTVDGIDARGVIAPSDIPVEVRDQHWEYLQKYAVATAEIDLPEQLKENPSVEIYNYSGNRIYGSIEFVNSRKIIIKFNSAIIFKVIFN